LICRKLQKYEAAKGGNKEFGWVFFYESRKYLETREGKYLLAGGGPAVVEKEDGSIHFLGTQKRSETSIRGYEEQRRRR